MDKKVEILLNEDNKISINTTLETPEMIKLLHFILDQHAKGEYKENRF